MYAGGKVSVLNVWRSWHELRGVHGAAVATDCAGDAGQRNLGVMWRGRLKKNLVNKGF